MNLINPDLWSYEFPWGSTVNPNTNNEVVISPNLVRFSPNKVEFSLSKVEFRVGHGIFNGYRVDEEGYPFPTQSPWGIGHVISKDQYHFGRYDFTISLPNFRGSWPAIWMVDTNPNGQGIPPEVDIFEHFRKDAFLSRFHITSTFHYGKAYGTSIQKSYWRLRPLDKVPINLTFIWSPVRMQWIINGREVIAVYHDIPQKPMNLLMGAGIGTMWGPRLDKINEAFIVSRALYSPRM